MENDYSYLTPQYLHNFYGRRLQTHDRAKLRHEIAQILVFEGFHAADIQLHAKTLANRYLEMVAV